MDYISINLNDFISIGKLYTIHYFEYMKDFSFAGESHDFWEFIYVDKGAVRITMDATEVVLHKGDIAFHRPNEFHKVIASENTAPNLIVISFSCHSPAMTYFRRKILKLDDRERALLADILIEARKLFDCVLDDPYMKMMPKKPNVPSGTEQLIRLYLELFLIHVYKRTTGSSTELKGPILKNSTDVFRRIVDYMELHISSKLTIERICKDNMIGRTQLQKIFQKECGMGIIEYYSKLKIDTAKHLIRNGNMNFSQIAEQLGYTSIHYFSRQFKKITDMTPSEYASSVKAITEKQNDHR